MEYSALAKIIVEVGKLKPLKIYKFCDLCRLPYPGHGLIYCRCGGIYTEYPEMTY
jgi:hypothetical protein